MGGGRGGVGGGFFFFNDTATTEIYTLSLHDALPIYIAKICQYQKHYHEFLQTLSLCIPHSFFCFVALMSEEDAEC